jgi:hypothetical protein
MSTHDASTMVMRELTVGTTVPYHGLDSLLLAIGPLHEGTEGMFANAEVIHHLPANDFHPWAVHNLCWDDEYNRFVFGSGDYCEDVETAVEMFKGRAGVKHLRDLKDRPRRPLA